MWFTRACSLGLVFLAGPVSADVWDSAEPTCNWLWFTRNLIMDRAGYCFGSPLGKAFFDNSDCRGTEVQLSTRESHQVKKMVALERELGCKVNTQARDLDVHYLVHPYKKLRDLPLPSGGETACLSWRGAAVPIFDGYTSGSKRIGEIRPGDWLGFSSESEGNWSAVTVSRGNNGIFGWFDHSKYDTQKGCTDWAG